jgi:hypothetical protein
MSQTEVLRAGAKLLAAPGHSRSMVDVETQSTVASSSTLTDRPLLTPDKAAHLLAVKTSWAYEAARAGESHASEWGDTYASRACHARRLVGRAGRAKPYAVTSPTRRCRETAREIALSSASGASLQADWVCGA